MPAGSSHFIILGGALRSCGAAMNGQLNKSIVNPWLASAISFTLITFFFLGAFLIMPRPLPTAKDISSRPWWAVAGGLVGAVQVYSGLPWSLK
jgi:transporter family-2 protein